MWSAGVTILKACQTRHLKVAAINGDEQNPFRRAMRDVKPLQVEERVVARPQPKARLRRSPDQIPRGAMARHLADVDAGDVDTGEELLFRGPGISERVFKRLRRGGFSIQDELDLHGMTVAQARDALKLFISECADAHRGCVRVIHGKGLGSGHRGPVLKAHVNRWLRHWDSVLAFATARTRDGGSGAVYVLIKRR
jgi:DNA-nicking Smr family endonuclease